jgi:RNA polymerase sigma-70 factor (ECF subfamily)
LDERLPDADAGPLEIVEHGERSASIDAALVKLSEEHRLVLVLRHFADLSYDEMSEALGIPEKTVKSRLFEARSRLGQLLRLEPGAH